ncbi:uncharacterized protein C18orf19 homolog A [Planococcus citri]|uniref:uncharacterized protein C18orf19 homolog A n=1 Tax=Planococcus citri TaxID=170843 RepID=UPI0031F9E859
MAVNLWKFACLRVPVKKINLIDAPYVTKFSTVSVPKNQISFPNVCNFSRIRILKNRYAYPALSGIPYDFKYVTINRVGNENTSSFLRHYSTSDKTASENTEKKSTDVKTEEKPPSLLQRFKQMYRDYWYVLVPVHLVTSAFWFSSFYYLAKSGVDVASLLESIGAGEKLVEKLRNGNSTMGYIAIAYALYKISTPVRYTVTLGGTTISIKYLKDWGYIKPIPPKDKIKSMINDRKELILNKTPKQLAKIYRQEKEAVKKIVEDEKKSLTEDKKGFYGVMFPKIVRPDDKKKKKIGENW